MRNPDGCSRRDFSVLDREFYIISYLVAGRSLHLLDRVRTVRCNGHFFRRTVRLPCLLHFSAVFIHDPRFTAGHAFRSGSIDMLDLNLHCIFILKGQNRLFILNLLTVHISGHIQLALAVILHDILQLVCPVFRIVAEACSRSVHFRDTELIGSGFGKGWKLYVLCLGRIALDPDGRDLAVGYASQAVSKGLGRRRFAFDLIFDRKGLLYRNYGIFVCEGSKVLDVPLGAVGSPAGRDHYQMVTVFGAFLRCPLDDYVSIPFIEQFQIAECVF